MPKETVDRDDDATIILIIMTSYYDYYYKLQLSITVYKGVTILCNARVESGAANGGVMSFLTERQWVYNRTDA